MEDNVVQLRERQKQLLSELAAVTVALDRTTGTIKGVPHFSVIEEHAHQAGQELSRRIQEHHAKAIVSQQVSRASCPGCGRSCELRPRRRKVRSIDGVIQMEELVGYCKACRRSFFPSTGGNGP